MDDELKDLVKDLIKRLDDLNERMDRRTEELMREVQKSKYPWDPLPLSREHQREMGPEYFPRGCSVCGIGANGEPMAYVCGRIDCPSRVVFTSKANG